jgi:hypothetical protein
MLTISKLVVVAVLMLGAASVAQAASENQSDPTRGATTGPAGQKLGASAVNPALHRSTRHVAHHSKSVAKKVNPNPDSETH